MPSALTVPPMNLTTLPSPILHSILLRLPIPDLGRVIQCASSLAKLFPVILAEKYKLMLDKPSSESTEEIALRFQKDYVELVPYYKDMRRKRLESDNFRKLTPLQTIRVLERLILFGKMFPLHDSAKVMFSFPRLIRLTILS